MVSVNNSAHWMMGLRMAMAAFVLTLGMPFSAQATDLPGEGKTVKPGRATWDTGWFHAEIYVRALEALGYNVEEFTTLDNPAFYQAVADGSLDLWVNGWLPGHAPFFQKVQDQASLVGYVTKGKAIQGYLVDKKTAQQLNITNLTDFKRPEVKKAFDTDGDGKAELVACPPGWGCENIIAHHLDAYDLRGVIDPIKAKYALAMGDALGRYKRGLPLFFYTWTPNWTVGVLKPGKDVVWIEVPFVSLPKEMKANESRAVVSDVEGCGSEPCKLGWPASDIRPVVNNDFLEANPAARRLFEVVRIPLADLFAQNARMFEGEDSEEDIERHASEWIEKNQATFDHWIDEAMQAAQ